MLKQIDSEIISSQWPIIKTTKKICIPSYLISGLGKNV